MLHLVASVQTHRPPKFGRPMGCVGRVDPYGLRHWRGHEQHPLPIGPLASARWRCPNATTLNGLPPNFHRTRCTTPYVSNVVTDLSRYTCI
jgi:hypothetical protein